MAMEANGRLERSNRKYLSPELLVTTDGYGGKRQA